MKKFVLLALPPLTALLLPFSPPLQAQSFQDVASNGRTTPPTNFVQEYPADKCRKPYKPSTFRSVADQTTFDNDVAKYKDCAAHYQEAAKADLARINKRIAESTQRLNAPY